MFFVESVKGKLLVTLNCLGGGGELRGVGELALLAHYKIAPPLSPPTHCQEISSKENKFYFLTDQFHFFVRLSW